MTVDIQLLREKLCYLDVSLKGYAAILGIAEKTLRNRMTGRTEFTRNEILKSIDLFGKEATMEIFFSNKVS